MPRVMPYILRSVLRGIAKLPNAVRTRQRLPSLSLAVYASDIKHWNSRSYRNACSFGLI